MNGEAKHTPGPWVTFVRASDGTKMVLAEGEPLSICNVNDFGGMPAKANARLIAAAPDLLQACESVMKCPVLHDENGHAYIKVDARSLFGTGAFISEAIAKAKGETP